MRSRDSFVTANLPPHAITATVDDRTRVLRFRSTEVEYEALATAVGIVDRSQRGLIQVDGRDRIAWTQTKSSNDVTTLAPGMSNYAFFLDNKGRIKFDGHVIVRSDSVWIELAQTAIEPAISHLSRYKITEDVSLSDMSDRHFRLALAGPKLVDPLSALGVSKAAELSPGRIGSFVWSGQTIEFIRTDFCGVPAIELFTSPEAAAGLWHSLSSGDAGFTARPVGDQVVEMMRIESGIPSLGHELTEEILPGETGRESVAVSLNKGCFLGHEIFERMRSRGVRAQRLMGIRLGGDELPPPSAQLLARSGETLGSVTSSCRSLRFDAVLGLGFIKTGFDVDGQAVRVKWGGRSSDAHLAELPFKP